MLPREGLWISPRGALNVNFTIRPSEHELGRMGPMALDGAISRAVHDEGMGRRQVVVRALIEWLTYRGYLPEQEGDYRW